MHLDVSSNKESTNTFGSNYLCIFYALEQIELILLIICGISVTLDRYFYSLMFLSILCVPTFRKSKDYVT